MEQNSQIEHGYRNFFYSAEQQCLICGRLTHNLYQPTRSQISSIRSCLLCFSNVCKEIMIHPEPQRKMNHKSGTFLYLGEQKCPTCHRSTHNFYRPMKYVPDLKVCSFCYDGVCKKITKMGFDYYSFPSYFDLGSFVKSYRDDNE